MSTICSTALAKAADNEGVARAVRSFFDADEDDLNLEFHLGATGMAIVNNWSRIRAFLPVNLGPTQVKRTGYLLSSA